MEAAHTPKCACGECDKKRVADGTQEDYERESRAATDAALERLKEDNDAPLCYTCNKKRAWSGECVDCYMAPRYQRVFERSEWWMPVPYKSRQLYWMEEEAYARQRRIERERHKAAKPLLAAAANADNAIVEAKAMPAGETESGFLKNLFQTVQGVAYDSKCPHGQPFYACMCCSH
jgi:hypothetical protein